MPSNSASSFLENSTSLFTPKKRLKASLNPGAIGLKCSPKELLEFAIKAGLLTFRRVDNNHLSLDQDYRPEGLPRPEIISRREDLPPADMGSTDVPTPPQLRRQLATLVLRDDEDEDEDEDVSVRRRLF